jgi:CubicO group peptidase (beta-lactamase class C family)
VKRPHKRVALAAVLVLLAGSAAGLAYGLRVAAIGTAYKAKVLCSGVFVSRRDPRSVLESDLGADDLAVLALIDARIEHAAGQVSAALFGFARRTAVHRPGLGCTLALSGARLPAGPAPRTQPAERPTVQEDPRLAEVLERAFSESDPALPRRTRAVAIVHEDRLVAERYAAGFTPDMPLPGWSMAKSVTGALAGVLAQQRKLALDQPVALPQWQAAGDARARITFGHLLRMTSGLRFDENYRSLRSDVMTMLLAEPDMGGYAAAKPLEHAPGSRWSYSSGTTNLLAYAMRRIVGEADYPAFPRRALFERLGMTSATMETDASGTFVGSSVMYASARDWARFGELYLHDGVWRGERILPSGWVAYARAPAPGAPEASFGAHFWLRIPHHYACGDSARPLPADAFHAIGHEGQFVTIVPSRRLVVVRLGLTRLPCAWDHAAFLEGVLRALDPG